MFTLVLVFDLMGEVIKILHVLCTLKDNFKISLTMLAINFAKPSIKKYINDSP